MTKTRIFYLELNKKNLIFIFYTVDFYIVLSLFLFLNIKYHCYVQNKTMFSKHILTFYTFITFYSFVQGEQNEIFQETEK